MDFPIVSGKALPQSLLFDLKISTIFTAITIKPFTTTIINDPTEPHIVPVDPAPIPAVPGINLLGAAPFPMAGAVGLEQKAESTNGQVALGFRPVVPYGPEWPDMPGTALPDGPEVPDGPERPDFHEAPSGPDESDALNPNPLYGSERHDAPDVPERHDMSHGPERHDEPDLGHVKSFIGGISTSMETVPNETHGLAAKSQLNGPKGLTGRT